METAALRRCFSTVFLFVSAFIACFVVCFVTGCDLFTVPLDSFIRESASDISGAGFSGGIPTPSGIYLLPPGSPARVHVTFSNPQDYDVVYSLSGTCNGGPLDGSLAFEQIDRTSARISFPVGAVLGDRYDFRIGIISRDGTRAFADYTPPPIVFNNPLLVNLTAAATGSGGGTMPGMSAEIPLEHRWINAITINWKYFASRNNEVVKSETYGWDESGQTLTAAYGYNPAARGCSHSIGLPWDFAMQFPVPISNGREPASQYYHCMVRVSDIYGLSATAYSPYYNSPHTDSPYNLNLLNLDLGPDVVLSPSFYGDTYSYDALVPSAAASLTLNCTAADSSAIIECPASGGPFTGSVVNRSIPLSVASYTFSVTVWDSSHTYKNIYSIKAQKRGSAAVSVTFSPTFADETFSGFSAGATASWTAATDIVISVDDIFSSYAWRVDGAAVPGTTGRSLELNARDFSVADHVVTLLGTNSSGSVFSKSVTFTITQ